MGEREREGHEKKQIQKKDRVSRKEKEKKYERVGDVDGMRGREKEERNK